MFWATALAGCLFAIPAALRTFLLIFFAVFFVMVLTAKGAIKGWQSTFSSSAILRLMFLGGVFALLSIIWVLQRRP